ncbi:hypothetical protein Q5752_002332 [Cryptotrichosporon argae]
MQNVVNAATAAASTAASHAAHLASAAANTLGVGSTGVDPSAPAHAHTHTHMHTHAAVPPDSTVGDVRAVDGEALQVFVDERVRHAVLVKINQLALDDIKHGLKEVAALDLYVEGGDKKGISYYHPLRYLTVQRPYGTDYIGEIEIEDGKAVHIRVHVPAPGAEPIFHSLDTRPSAEGGAVFATGEPLSWFDY